MRDDDSDEDLRDEKWSPAPVEGVEVRLSKVAASLILGGLVVMFMIGLLATSNWWHGVRGDPGSNRDDARLKTLLLGVLLLGGSVYSAYRLTRAVWVGQRIVIARDRMQVVEGRGPRATVLIQIPYGNIESLKAEILSHDIAVGLRIYVHATDHPSTVLPDSEIKTDNRGRYYELGSAYIGSMNRIQAAIERAQQKWQELPEAPPHPPPRPRAVPPSEPSPLVEAEVIEAETVEGAEERAPEPKRFKVKRFSPGGRGSWNGLLAAAAVGAVAAVILSVVCALIGSFFWLLIFFPIFHGIAVGLAPGLVGRVTKADYPALLALIGAASGALSVFGVHYLDYLASPINPGARAAGFWEFMRLRAAEGVRISEVFQAGKGSNLGFTGSIIYWLIELFFAMGAAGSAAMAFVQDPLCRECRAWKEGQKLGPYKLDLEAATGAASAGCPAKMVSPTDGDDTVTIEIFTCPNCDRSGIEVRVSGTRKEKGRTVIAAPVLVAYPDSAQPEFDDLRRTCKRKKLKAT